MINKDTFGLRTLALKAFSEIIDHCRNTPVVTDQVKQTRIGLQRISLNYVEGLSKLYLSSGLNTEVHFSDESRTQILKAIQDFGSISKTVTLNNKFLTSFAELVSIKENKLIEVE